MTSTSSSGSDAGAAPTVGQLLRDAAARLTETGSDTPRLDAEVLLGHVLRVDRATLLTEPGTHVGATHAGEFEQLVERRATGEPVAYIRGLKEFYGLALSVDSRALIPRPETETLVDLALSRIAEMLTAAPRDAGARLRVWDVGTGSGAIVVALAVESRRRGYTRDVEFVATDVSAQALSLAVENAVVHGVGDAIEFRAADLVDAQDVAPVDLLVANLPYIATDVVPILPVAASFEPPLALDGGADGLRPIAALVQRLPGVLRPRAVCLLEIGADQADAVRELVAVLGEGWACEVHRDLADRPRVAEIRRVDDGG